MAKKPIEDLVPGDLIADRYRVEGVLGEGGFGRVLRARHRVTEEPCAVKILVPEMMQTAEAHARLHNEVRAAARTRSPHAIRLFDVGFDPPTGATWIAMELLLGETLDARMKRLGPLSWSEARALFAQLGDAFGAAHENNVLHLDIKPENLFLSQTQLRDQPTTLLKVIDFGISRLIAEGRSHVTVAKSVYSTKWFAPEQSVPGAEMRPTADVWALGLVAFWALCGREYWQSVARPGVTIHAILVEVIGSPLAAASARAEALGVDPARLPPGFDAWFARAVNRTESERFANAREAMGALTALFDRAVPEPTHPQVEAPPSAPVSGSAPTAPYADTATVETSTEPWGRGDPDAAIWRTKAECSVQLGMFNEAVDEFSAAIARAPWDAQSYRGRSRAWRALGRTALADADEAVARAMTAATP